MGAGPMGVAWFVRPIGLYSYSKSAVLRDDEGPPLSLGAAGFMLPVGPVPTCTEQLCAAGGRFSPGQDSTVSWK